MPASRRTHNSVIVHGNSKEIFAVLNDLQSGVHIVQGSGMLHFDGVLQNKGIVARFFNFCGIGIAIVAIRRASLISTAGEDQYKGLIVTHQDRRQ